MDDQQGNVIDGTARARQWRLARAKTRAATDGAEARSDAPKSIAGSLLVPADMLPAPFPDDGNLNENARGEADEPPPGVKTQTTDRAPVEDAPHQNPFLVPEAARIEHGSRPARRIAALLAHPRGLTSARRRLSRRRRYLVAMPGRLREPRLARRLAIAALTGAVVITALSTARPNAGHPSSAPALGAAGPLRTRQREALTAGSKLFPQQVAARGRASHWVRRARPHQTLSTHRRPQPATKPAVLQARYTPPVSQAGNSASTSATPGYASSSPVAAAVQPTPSAAGGTTSATANSAGSRPAFGQNGTLGPGHSPNS
jgi:hypothetical protein